MNRSRFTRFLVVAGFATICLFAQGKDGADSPEALAKQIFTALEHQDSAALQQLSIDQGEFKQFIWPVVGLKTSGNMTAEKFYEMYSASSGTGIAENLKRYGGRKWEVLKVTLDPLRKQTKSYRLLPGAQIALRDETGEGKTVMLGSILEHDGRYKVATYYVRATQ